MIFEMAGSYEMLVPLVLAAAIGYAVARPFQGGSAYTIALHGRGIFLGQGPSGGPKMGASRPEGPPGYFAASSWSANRSSDVATLASGSIRASVHSWPQRRANAAASRRRSSIRTHAASWCGSR